MPQAASMNSACWANMKAALAWFTTEYRNLLAAGDLALRLEFDAHTWQLAWTLSDFLARSGHWPDHYTVHRNALHAAERSGRKDALAYSHRGLGVAIARLGHPDARRHYERALHLFEEIGDHGGQGTTHINLANLFDGNGWIASPTSTGSSATGTKPLPTTS